jgi:putative PIN family toxin of toxin-antitoxin system
MKVILDTSILFQALYSSNGASHELLRRIRIGDLQIPISIPVFSEYCDVLLGQNSLDQFKLTKTEVQHVLDFIALAGTKTDIRFLLRPNLRDENDNIFMELACASNTSFIITRNVRDFIHRPELKFDEIQICTPAEFLQERST